ncbi:DNA replication checkpoint protein tel2 [Echria macrotheca]|uniref:DNA replication checkpoint protein tel2 n=1 Tax=Echria macrotheca TaxID=438768 RepID=A0AAJ0FBP6_9PEZI|nr:DNA replication checkpoint protein tel2 [Echria macrotheca]
MDDFLTPVATFRRNAGSGELQLVQEVKGKSKPQLKSPTQPEDALEILRHEPEYDSLITALRYLSPSSQQPDAAGFDIRKPSPLSAQLVQVLASDIVPNYWAILKEDSAEDKRSGLALLLACLQSITGINAVLARMRATIQEIRSEQTRKEKRPDLTLNLGILVDLLHQLIRADDRVAQIWKSTTSGLESRGRLRPLEQELVTVFGGGRIVSLVAEAEDLLRAEKSKGGPRETWLGDSLRYTNWIGDNIINGQASESGPEKSKFFSALFAKALSLGHPESLIRHLLERLLLNSGPQSDVFGGLLDGLSPTEQRKVLFSVLKILSSDHLDRLGLCDSSQSQESISAVAAVISSTTSQSQTRKGHLLEWLTSSSGAGVGEGVGIRRAVLAVVSQDRESIVEVLEKSVAQFGDQLYIKHSPMLQQEAHAQVLLLSAGYVHRISPLKLTMLMRTSPWLNAISNRLAASHQRARFLGMIVGEGLSSLVHEGDKRLDFHMPETDSDEGKWYKGLVQTSDKIGSLSILLKPGETTPIKSKPKPKQATKRAAPQQPKTGFIIEELSDEEMDDVVPYGKPDSDEEDSDEDPTLVQRNKPKAPVYVRDLIRYLRDTENYEHQRLALTTAPTLIRRKANYGTEVAEHAEELASLLIGLQNKYDIDNFDDLKLQGTIAIVVAQPKAMAPWFAKTFFDGDYSISQRVSVLITLGLGGRELAGIETSDYAAAASFPSKHLPEQVERLYIDADPSRSQASSGSSLKPLPPNALDNMARSLTKDMLAPMAAAAADSATGPDVLKLSTFTSRLNDKDHQSKVKVKSRARPRIRSIPNTTAQLIATGFFSPLTARFQAALHSSASRARGIIFQPYLLALYLKTLALLLHAAGPSTLALPDMTAELWGLLLSTSVRAQAVDDLGVTQSLLFGLLAILDVNEDRMRDLCREMGKEMVETQEWVSGVFGRLRGGDSGGDEDQVKMLAAGVLVRLNEGMEKYRLLMVGDLIGYR